jgi:hypothetical protein
MGDSWFAGLFLCVLVLSPLFQFLLFICIYFTVSVLLDQPRVMKVLSGFMLSFLFAYFYHVRQPSCVDGMGCLWGFFSHWTILEDFSRKKKHKNMEIVFQYRTGKTKNTQNDCLTEEYVPLLLSLIFLWFILLLFFASVLYLLFSVWPICTLRRYEKRNFNMILNIPP